MYEKEFFWINKSATVPIPNIIISNENPLAGNELRLTCNYMLGQSVDTVLPTFISWRVNDSAINPVPGRSSSNGNYLTFSPLYTSDSGRYTCSYIEYDKYTICCSPGTKDKSRKSLNCKQQVYSIPFLSL